MRSAHLAGEDCYKTKARGMAVLTTPLLNKGTAFTLEEREDLGSDRSAAAGDQHLNGAGEGSLCSVPAPSRCAQ